MFKHIYGEIMTPLGSTYLEIEITMHIRPLNLRSALFLRVMEGEAHPVQPQSQIPAVVLILLTLNSNQLKIA